MDWFCLTYNCGSAQIWTITNFFTSSNIGDIKFCKFKGGSGPPDPPSRSAHVTILSKKKNEVTYWRIQKGVRYGGCIPLWISKYRKNVKKEVKTGERENKKRETAIYIIYFFDYYVFTCLDMDKQEIFQKLFHLNPYMLLGFFCFQEHFVL